MFKGLFGLYLLSGSHVGICAYVIRYVIIKFIHIID